MAEDMAELKGVDAHNEGDEAGRGKCLRPVTTQQVQRML
jgi:hypothetical protein